MSIVVNSLALLGAILTLISAIGAVRLPHLLWRMHAAAKAGTLGAGLLLAAVALSAPAAVASRAVVATLFLFLTAPVATHMLGRCVAGALPKGPRGHVVPPDAVVSPDEEVV